MVKASPIITAVNSGEFSPRMESRVDFDRYRNACKRARNLVLLPEGGFCNRPGTRYVADIMDETKEGRIIPFKFSQSDAYVIELGENSFRFIKRQARLTVPNTNASVTNGAFASNITGWDDVSTGSGAIAHDSTNNRMRLTGATASIAWAEQDITTSNTNEVHVIAFKVEGDLGAKALFQVGSSSGGAQFHSQIELGLGWHVVEFTPTSSPFYVQFGNDNDPAENIYIDDVSMLDNEVLSLTHDYSESELQDIRAVQTADVIYLFHPTKQTRKLERRSDRTWSLVDVYWVDGPYGEENPGTDLDRKQLVTNPLFEDGMYGWDDVSVAGGSNNGIAEYDGSQNIVILRRGDANEEGAIEQTITTGAGGTDEYVLHFQIVGGGDGDNLTEVLVSTSAGGGQIISATGYEAGWYSVPFSTNAATIYIKFQFEGDTDVAGGVGGCLLYRENSNLLELSGTTGSVTCTAMGDFAPFTSDDVGRSIRLSWFGKEPTWGVITAYSSASSVTVRLRRDAPYSNTPTESWYLGEWCTEKGFPTVAGFFQSRIVAANTTSQPQTLWFSQTSDLENMRPDSWVTGSGVTEDDDALIYTISSAEIDPIAWIRGQRKMIIGTGGGQWIAESQGPAIKATDISVTKHSDVPCKVDALSAEIASGDTVVFIEEAGRKVHDLGYNFDTDGFVPADLTILSDHITKSPIKQMAFQRRPFSVIWALREDGRLVSLAYNRRQDIIGWSQHIPGGSFGSGAPVVESIAIIPGASDATQQYNSDERDEIWLIVKRTVNGNTVRTIEFFEGYFDGPLREDYATEALWQAAVQDASEDAFYVDSGGTYDSPIDLTAATAANPVVVTTDGAHGLSDGDEIQITDVVDMTELNLNKYLVAASTSTTLSLASNTNGVAITGATMANPVVVTATAHGKSNGDKIAIFDVSGMTELNGNIYTVANKTDDTFELSGINGTGYTAYTSGGTLYDTIDGSAYTAYSSGGEVRATITTLTGLTHLEGETINLLVDGQIHPQETVSSGQVTLDYSGGKVQWGLPYTWEYESLKLPYGTQSGSGVGKTKKINALSLCLVDTGKFSVGTVTYHQNQGRRELSQQTIDFVLDGSGDDNAVPLFTGEVFRNISATSERDSRIYLTSSNPVPFCCTAIAPQMYTGER